MHNAISGKPAPYITYHNGGFMVHNSYMAEHNLFGLSDGDGRSYVAGGVGHIRRGASSSTIKHEAGHISQELRQGIGGIGNNGNSFFNSIEYNNDLRSGTMRYGLSSFLFKALLSPELYNALFLANAYSDPTHMALVEMIMQARDPAHNLNDLLLILFVDSR